MSNIFTNTNFSGQSGNQRNRRRQRDLPDNDDQGNNRRNSGRRSRNSSARSSRNSSPTRRSVPDNSSNRGSNGSGNRRRSNSRGRNRTRESDGNHDSIVNALTAALEAVALQSSRSRSRGRSTRPQRSRSQSASRRSVSHRQSFMNYEFRDGNARVVGDDPRALPSTLSTQVVVPGKYGRLEIKFNYPGYAEAFDRALGDPTAVFVQRQDLREYLAGVVDNIVGAFDYHYQDSYACPADIRPLAPAPPPNDTSVVLDGFTAATSSTDDLPVGGGDWQDYGA